MLLLILGYISAAGSSTGWSRGSYGVLSFTADCSNYTWTYGPNVFRSNPSNATSCSTSSGSDNAHGGYDELALTYGADGELAVRYYPLKDAFVFQRRPKTLQLPQAFPSFSSDGYPEGADNLTLRCLGWGETYFFPGQVLPRTAHTRPQPFTLKQCGSGGPMFVFGVASGSGHAYAISPLDNFTTQGVDRFGITVGKGGCKDRCSLFPTSSVMMARPGLVRATRAFGSFLRQHHNTTRMRGPGVTQLAYWNDNQAGYSWWTVGPDQEVWGKPEEIYLKLKEGYDKAGVPIRGWEPDNNWLADYGGGASQWGNGTGTAKNWIGRQWDYNPELYPSGGEDFVSKLGNLSMTYYTNGFGADNAYKRNKAYRQQKNNEPHPTTSYLMYSDLIKNAKEKYNMEMLFTDFLCYRQPAMEQYQDVPAGEEGGHLWLGGQAKAAGDNGVEVQWCMALAHQILESAQFGSVTNTRVNGDGGLNIQGLTMPALLAATVGLGWSKDNLRTADKCYVDGLYPNGTVKWPCGSINKGEGTSGTFKMQEQQTIFAALSLGPVGISDQLSSYPTNVSATITSNVPLVMATCAATGDLLQPSYPLTPLERSLAGTVAASVELWGTYTAVPRTSATASDGGSTSDGGSYGGKPVMLWFTAFAFCNGKGCKGIANVMESDLAPMVDNAALPSPDFSDVPTGVFNGSGTSFPAGPVGWVGWVGDFMQQRTAGCSAVNVTDWVGQATFPLSMSGSDAIYNVAPIVGTSFALLGEQGKVSAVSTYRFSSVAASAAGKGIAVGLRGKPSESVTLLFAAKQGSAWICKALTSTVGADGTGSVTFLG